MKLTIIEKHVDEGYFPTFERGTAVTLLTPCAYFKHWWSCDIQGIQTYVPESYVEAGTLNRSYNPTELSCEVGDRVDLLEIVNAWMIVKDAKDNIGWIPCEKTVSV